MGRCARLGSAGFVGLGTDPVMASRRYRYAKLGVLVCGALVCLVPLVQLLQRRRPSAANLERVDHFFEGVEHDDIVA